MAGHDVAVLEILEIEAPTSLAEDPSILVDTQVLSAWTLLPATQQFDPFSAPCDQILQ